jgi:hypothetical protein
VTIPIQTTPPATLGRACARAARRCRGRGRGSGAGARRGFAGAYASPYLDRRPKLRRGRARVLGGLLRRRAHGFARQETHRGLVPADADGKLGRARAPAYLGGEKPLDHPVFERVEADDGEPTAGPEHRERRRKRALERVELFVHGDPQRLKDALRRMAVAEAARGRDRRLHDVDQLAGPLEWLLLPPAHDRLRDLPCEALLAIATEDRRQLALVPLVDDLARAQLARRIHPHVEGRVDCIREAALGTVDLHARDAEVEEDRIGLDAVRAELREDDGELASQEAGLHPCFTLEALEERAHGRIAVDGDEPPPALEVGGEQARVSARAEGRVDDGLAGAHGEQPSHLAREDGDVISPASLQGARQQAPHSLPPLRVASAMRPGPRSRRGLAPPRPRLPGRGRRGR